MELNSIHKSSVLKDPSPSVNKSRLSVSSSKFIPSSRFMMAQRKKPAKLDDVRSNGWLDAMISSSPPHKKLIKDFNVEVAPEDDFAQRSWMVKYPSDDPDRAIMSDSMRSSVKDVASYFPTAIISGRSRDKVYQLVGLTELYYAGSHGMDIMTSNDPNRFKSTDQQGKEVNLFQPAREFIPIIDEVFRTLVEKMKDIKGAKVDNHKFCASVHYRNVDEKDWPIIAQCVHDHLKQYPRLRLTHGRKVLEVRPVIDWNKGRAVEFLLESLGLSNKDDLLPIYIGDDTTDEDAFKALRDGNRGFGILLSSIPKESNAFYSLRDPSEVKKFLKTLVKWAVLEKDSTSF